MSLREAIGSPWAGKSKAGFNTASLRSDWAVGVRPASVQWSQSVVYGDQSLPDEASASPERTINGPVLPALLNGLGSEWHERVRSAVESAYLVGEMDGPRSFASTAWVVTGVR